MISVFSSGWRVASTAFTKLEEQSRMETISFGTSTVAERPTAPAVSSVGFNNNGRVAENHNDLRAALFAIASHDLRQPLQVIMCAHDILAKTLNRRGRQGKCGRGACSRNRLAAKID